MGIILEDIDTKCAEYLSGYKGYVNLLWQENLVAHGSTPPTIAAFKGTGGTNLPDGYSLLLVNDAGPFFNAGFTVDGDYRTLSVNQGKIPSDTDKARVLLTE